MPLGGVDLEMKALAHRLRDLREAAGYSQAGLADLIPISAAQISRWESGKQRPDLDHLARLAEIYECHITDILSGVELLTSWQESQRARAGTVEALSLTRALEGDREPGDPSDVVVPDIQHWKRLAQTLADAVKMQQENDRTRIEKQAETEQRRITEQAETERLRIRQVDAVAHGNLSRVLERLERLEGSAATSRGEDGAEAEGTVG